MGAFGERLRREREMRGITLDDIAATTKIGTRLLRALEDEQFDLLPGGIFNKGYVRAYAKYVGIDEERAVADYLQAVHEVAPGGHVAADQIAASRFERSSYDEATTGRGSTLPVVPILIALVLIAGIAGGWRLYRERQRDQQPRAAMAVTPDTTTQGSTPTSPAASTSITEKSSSAETGSGATSHGRADVLASASHSADARANTPMPVTAPVSPAPNTNNNNNAANPAGDKLFELTVRPKDRAWVSIKSDGKFVVRGIIKPPDVKTIHASSEVVFWTGNAGAVEVSFNGQNVPLTGGENDERVLVFNSRGLLPSPASQ